MRKLAWGAVVWALLGAALTAQGFEHFITRQGDRLMDGPNEFRFISFNIPNLHYVEDHMPFGEMNSWRLPDEFEITDALLAIKQMGGRVARTYTLSVRRADDDPAIPRHVLAPGKYNEDAFRALDKVLQVANETGVRVIIPFVDNWIWWGGIQEYAAFRGKDKDAFWTDAEVIGDFQRTIAYVLNRVNTYTGVRYKDDKAILAWETGNELQCPSAWTRQIVAYIKHLDRNHLVVDGYFTSVLRDDAIDNPLVDVVTTHHYPSDPQLMIDRVRKNRERAKGKKPYFVGEFGFVETDAVRELLDVVIDGGTSGALIWSLRFRSRDGGFYWHSEPFGGDRYKAYHWPGFASGDNYDERALVNLMREKGYAIQGVTPPKLAAPKPPRLLPIEDVAAISWQGSAGAASHTVERAMKEKGPWTVVGRGISDAATPYRPLFTDTQVRIGEEYFYQVRAENEGGSSDPSNVVGPVKVKWLMLVDEMRNFDSMSTHAGIALETGNTRQAKEDLDRVVGNGRATIVYETPKPLRRCEISAFFPMAVADLQLSVSSDGLHYRRVPVERTDYFGGEGEYGYFKPVLFTAALDTIESRFLKIEFTGLTQISRVEITYGGAK